MYRLARGLTADINDREGVVDVDAAAARAGQSCYRGTGLPRRPDSDLIRSPGSPRRFFP
jgi:hypothetical protein